MFQDYINTRTTFEIQTFERSFKSEAQATKEKEQLFKSYDITKSIKDNEFNLQNASYVFRLSFSLNNTFLLKEFLQQVDIITISAKHITLLSRDRIGKLECKEWRFNIEFDFQKLDDVQERFDLSYTSCNDNYGEENQEKKGADLIFFREFLFYNIISFVINIILTIFLVDLIINIFKYRTFREDKIKKYTWLLRNKREFLTKVKYFI